MSKEMVISVNPHETRVAILEEGQLCEYYVEREKEFALVGSIYKGRVTRVLPGMQSAFVEIGLDSDAFLYVSDFLEDTEDLDSVVTTAEEKIHKIEEQGGRAFAEGQPAAAPALEPVDVEPVSPSEAAAAAAPQEHAAPAGHIEALPGERLSPAAPGEVRIAPPSSFGGGRSRFGDRGRGGRDRFGGRGRGGRGGRFDRHGRGGNRDRRPGGGRDLPPSKYASPGSHESHHESHHESQPSEPLPADYTPVVLPGESFAKYRQRPALEPTTTSSEGGPISASSGSDVLDAVREDVTSAPREISSETPAFQHGSSHEPRHSSSAGFEPLPGESISKWRRSDASLSDAVVAFSAPESSAIPEHRENMEAALHDAEEVAHAEEHEDSHDDDDAPGIGAATAHEEDADLNSNDHVVAERSAEEMAAHAQRVAEMHIEQNVVEDDAEEEGLEEGAEDEIAEFAQAELARAGETAEAIDETEDGIELEASEAGEVNDEEEEEGAHELDAEAEVRESLLAFDTSEGGEGGESLHAAENGAAEPGAQGEQQPWKATVRGDSRARMQHPHRRGGGRDRDRGGRRNDRGRRPHHGGGHGHHHHRQQPRKVQLISDLLKQGQEIIVQIAKEPLGKKGARITSHVALPGRYLVYMPTLHHTGVSRKIASAEERARLRHLVNDAKGTAGGGFIVRTAASSAPPEDVRADVEFLTRTWSDIKSRSEQRKAPSVLHRDLNLVERILRDFVNSDFGAVWVDSEEDYAKVVEFMGRFQPALVSRVKLYTKETPVFEEFGIQQEIDKGLRPKVWLKSGGYIVINHTEALVAIDVNTGKFVGKGSTRLEDTIVRTNLEAVKEIVRQMRLRDLGGIIVIDFIDMEERRNREKVMAALEDALRADRAPSKVLRFNEFGLVAITRKRTKQALERTLCQPCPYCAGSGMVKSIPTLCYEIQAEAKKMAPEMDSASITLRVNPEISKALKTRESSLVEELERWTKKSVIIQGDPALHWEQYDIY